MPELGQVRTDVLVWGLLTAAALVLAAALWRLRPHVRRLLNPQPVEPAPWSGAEVYAVLLVYFLLPGLVHSALSSVGRLPPVLGGVVGSGALVAADKLIAQRREPWVILASTPLLVASVLLLTRLASGTRPSQLGLCSRRLGANLGLGLLAAVVWTPALNALHAAVSWLFLECFHAVPEEHPLSRLAEQPLAPAEWVALVGSAVVTAPLVEELLFRGVLQRWLAGRRWGGDAALAGALALAVLRRAHKLGPAWEDGTPTSLLAELAPALFVLALLPPYFLLRCRATTPGPAAVYGTAALFAALHASVWPTPVPLFVLGLVLGFLMQRTQTLVAPFVLHAVFNATACGVLLLGCR